MSCSFLNNHIRKLPCPWDNYFSICPSNLPPGTLLIHKLQSTNDDGDEKGKTPIISSSSSVTSREDTMETASTRSTYETASSFSYNIQRVFLLKNIPIVDHDWTTTHGSHSSNSNKQNESICPSYDVYLVTLTLQSHVNIYCLDIQSLGEYTTCNTHKTQVRQSLHAKLTPVHSFSVPSVSTSLCIQGSILAILTGSGLHVYHIHDFIPSFSTIIQPRTILLPYYTIHACTISYPYIAIASIHRIGIWDIQHLIPIRNQKSENNNDDDDEDPGQEMEKKSLQSSTCIPCIWSTTIHTCECRITSIVLFGFNHEYLAISTWDGTLYVFHHKHSTTTTMDNAVVSRTSPYHHDYNLIWNQSYTPFESFEEMIFPTFINIVTKQPSHVVVVVDDDDHDNLIHRNKNPCGLHPTFVLILSTPGSLLLRVLDINQMVITSYLGKQARDTGETHIVYGMVTFQNDIVVWVDNKMYLHIEEILF